jgi:hypothetical protein
VSGEPAFHCPFSLIRLHRHGQPIVVRYGLHYTLVQSAARWVFRIAIRFTWSSGFSVVCCGLRFGAISGDYEIEMAVPSYRCAWLELLLIPSEWSSTSLTEGSSGQCCLGQSSLLLAQRCCSQPFLPLGLS